MKKPAIEMKTYLLHMKGGTHQKVTVPANWKVTFGPLCPGGKGYSENGSNSMSLRFYESANNQRAVFTGVQSFRDESIKVMEKITRTQQQTMSKRTGNGAKDVVVEARVSEWIDPDAPPKPGKEFTQLQQLTTEDF